MNRMLTAALGAALAVASVSASAAKNESGFFLNAGVGQAQYHVGRTDGLGYKLDDKDTAGALRFGYAWRVAPALNLGVEAGYVDLGKIVTNYHYETIDGYYEHEHFDAGASGWLAGVNGKYNFADKWYVSARAGWFGATTDATYSYRQPGFSAYASDDIDGDGWYGGVGVGYDFAPNFSLGLNYDNYHVKADNDLVELDNNASAFMFTAEYRF